MGRDSKSSSKVYDLRTGDGSRIQAWADGERGEVLIQIDVVDPTGDSTAMVILTTKQAHALAIMLANVRASAQVDLPALREEAGLG